MSLKVLEREENAWRRIEQKSYFFKKRYYIPNIELDHEPYCPERTLLSKMELNRYYRNPLLHEPTAEDKYYKQKKLDNPLENSDIYGIKDVEKKYHAPPDSNPQSFGYRVGEGGHHFDALTLSVKKPKQKKLPAEPDGLLSAGRLNTLLHSKVKRNEYSGDVSELEMLLRAPNAKAMSDITCKPHKPTYEESLQDPKVQKKFEDTVIPPKVIKNGTLTPIGKAKKKNKKELYLKELESGFDNKILHTHQVRHNSVPILTREKQINNKDKYAKLAANKLTTTLCVEKIMTDDILNTMFPDTIDRYKREDEGTHREYLCRSVVHTTSPRPMRKKLFSAE